MFSLNSAQRYRLYNRPTDMRKSFDGLCGILYRELKTKPQNGEVFVFVNKRRNRIKLLHWEPGGLVLYYKRLEEGALSLPWGEEPSQLISWRALMLIIEGIEAATVQKKARMEAPPGVVKV